MSMLSTIAAPKLLLTSAVLGVLLLASAGLNVKQALDHREYKRGEAARLKQAATDAALKATATIAAQRARDSRALLDDLQAIVERGRETRTVYRTVAARAPLPAQCAPGRARIDAVNAGADK